MKELKLSEVNDYVEQNIGTFHRKRIESINKLKLVKVLKKRILTFFKAKHILTSEQLIKGLVDAYVSSNEETIFGDWLEGLAIFVNSQVYGGYKSGITGIDLEFDKDQVRNIIAIKSGPSWGNSSQIKKMISDFKTAKRVLRTSNSQLNIIAINGCCYGQDKRPDKGDYFKYCGKIFWEYISGNSDLYIKLIEPLGTKSRERNEEFIASYSQMINMFSRDFMLDFCTIQGTIDWEKLVKFNSGE